MPKPSRFAPLVVLLLSCTSLSGAQAGWFDFGSSSKDAKTEPKSDKSAKSDKAVKDNTGNAPTPAATLEESIRQAQLLRLAGSYPEAIRNLSQMMMVAADDPRVVSEYGKTLAAMGRAQDAISFLTRAQQLQPGDWTVYSALGVAYDQVSNQREAQVAYEHALAIKPGEPSVLSNYALSRLLAKDTAMASNLAARAESANTNQDEKIARNIAMVHQMAGDKPATAVAASKPPTQVAAAQTPAFVNMPPVAAPRQPVQRQVAIPEPPAPQAPMFQPQPQQMAQQQAPAPSGVVMQRVPVDPLAGPVGGPAANRAPRALQPKKAEAVARAEPAPAHAETARAEPARTTASHVAAAPVSAATGKPMSPAEALQARAEAIAKNIANKPAAIAAAKNEASKPAPGAPAMPVKTADTKPAPVATPAAKAPAPAPVKVAEAKPAALVKTAAAPAPATKTAAAKPKDAVPALRVSSSAY